MQMVIVAEWKCKHGYNWELCWTNIGIRGCVNGVQDVQDFPRMVLDNAHIILACLCASHVDTVLTNLIIMRRLQV